MIRLTPPPSATTIAASTLADGPAMRHIVEGEPSEAVRNFRIALVNMPFVSVARPSIQLGLLKAIVRRAGFPVDDHYLNVALGVQIGREVYDKVTESGDALFARAAFGDEAASFDAIIASVDEQISDDEADSLKELRERTLPAFVDECLASIDWGAYRVVAFTSCFIQNVACLALARRIKETYPEVVIILGGSNVDAEMGVEFVRAFAYVDYAISGEGDVVFPELLTRLAEGSSVYDLVGVISHREDAVHYIGSAEPIRDLDSLPTPDYDSYYAAIDRYGIANDPEFVRFEREWEGIPVQGSRGCWWGEKSHCTFCAFLVDGMEFRTKSPERFLAELDELSSKYNRRHFVVTDSIMNMKYLDGVFRRVADGTFDFEFNYLFIKANLTRDQVKLMARGGIRKVIPGIESLNSHVLKLMRKGTSKLQNVNLLRWAGYYRIHVGWNLLYGFPEETIEDYADERETMRRLRHLRPPGQHMRIILERFSPNFSDTEHFPLETRRPNQSYSLVYPQRVNVEEMAFFWDCDATDALPDEAHAESHALFMEWHADWNGDSDRRPSLTYKRSDADLLITDTRFSREQPRSYTLLGPDADIYEAFSSAPRTPAQVCADLSTDCPGHEVDETFVRCVCDDLCDAGLMLVDGGKYLSLALPAEPGL